MIIRDVTTISSHKGDLLLHTDSGVIICITCINTPDCINLESFLDENGEVLSIDVVIDWNK